MILTYQEAPLYLYGFHHQLGSLRRDIGTLKQQNLLSNEVKTLSATGYHYNFGVAEGQSLVDIATVTLSSCLKELGEPGALVFQHCNAESAVLPCDPSDRTWATRNRYFPAAVMQEIGLDNLPYFGSFASGCAGFLSLLVTASGLRYSMKE